MQKKHGLKSGGWRSGGRHKLNTGQKLLLVVKMPTAYCAAYGAASRLRKRSFPFSWPLQEHTWSAVPSSGLPHGHGQYGVDPAEGCQDGARSILECLTGLGLLRLQRKS